jgi:adenine-specific DNA-methyltransferase
VQLPEPIDPKKNKMAFDFVKDELKAEPTIFEITKERLLKAAKKINVSLDEKTAKLKSELPTLENKEAIEKLVLCKAQNTFKVFETTPIWENYDFEAEQFDSSQKLFDVGRLSEDDIKALLTTWKTYDGIPLTAELLVVSLECLVEDETQNSTLKTQNYEAYYGNNKLYLMNKGFNTNHLKALLEKIDTDKHFEPKSLIAFGHHLESKSLREISENVKNYNNKKKSDIDFITRY